MKGDPQVLLSSKEVMPPRPTYGYTGEYTTGPLMAPKQGWMVGGRPRTPQEALDAFVVYGNSLEQQIERLTRGMNGQADVMVAREREFAAALLRIDELERANVGLATESEQRRAALEDAADMLHECALECMDCNYGCGATGKGSEGDPCDECSPTREAERRAREVLSGEPDSAPSRSVQRRLDAQRASDETKDARDAARYRWLRDRINWRDGEMGMSTARTAPIITYKTRSWTHQDVRPEAERPVSEHIDEYIDGQLGSAVKASAEPAQPYQRKCSRCGGMGSSATPEGVGVYYCSIECAD